MRKRQFTLRGRDVQEHAASLSREELLFAAAGGLPRPAGGAHPGRVRRWAMLLLPPLWPSTEPGLFSRCQPGSL